MPLCTQGDLEALRQIDVTAEPDSTISTLISHAEAIVEGVSNRRFDVVTDLELRIEDASFVDSTVYLPHFPITALEVTLPDATVLAVNLDYHLHPWGRVHRLGFGSGVSTWDWQYNVTSSSGTAPWPRGTVFKYSGGIGDPADTPRDLRTLCAQILADLFDLGAASALSGGGVQSESMGSWSVAYQQVAGNLTRQQKKVAQRYAHKLPVVTI